MFLALTAGPRRIQQRAECHEDRPWSQWGMLARAGKPRYWYAEGPVDHLHLGLEHRVLERVALEACGMGLTRVALQHVFGARDPVVTQGGCALGAALHTGRPGWAGVCDLAGPVLALHFLRPSWARPPVLRHYPGGLPQHTLRRVRVYSTEHLAQPIYLGDLAALVQIDAYHVLRAFRQATGRAPRQYILICRMERVHTLLTALTVPITEVAFRVSLQARVTSLCTAAHRRVGPRPSIAAKCSQGRGRERQGTVCGVPLGHSVEVTSGRDSLPGVHMLPALCPRYQTAICRQSRQCLNSTLAVWVVLIPRMCRPTFMGPVGSDEGNMHRQAIQSVREQA